MIEKIAALRKLDTGKDCIDDDLLDFAVEHKLGIADILLVQVVRELKGLNPNTKKNKKK